CENADPHRHDRTARAALSGVHRAMNDDVDIMEPIEFDEVLQLALAESAAAADAAPSPDVKRRLMQRVHDAAEPTGFSFAWRAAAGRTSAGGNAHLTGHPFRCGGRRD